MTAAPRTRAPARDADTEREPVIHGAVYDDIRQIVENTALNHTNYADALAALQALGAIPAATGVIWAEYVDAIDAIYRLNTGADPSQWCDADQGGITEADCRDWAICDQADRRDYLYRRMTGEAP